jgi:hypothetical protein
MTKDVEGEEETRGVQTSRVVVNHHLRVRADSETREEPRGFVLGGEPESAGGHSNPHIVDADMERARNMTLPIILRLVDMVDEAQIRIVEPRLQPCHIPREGDSP